MTERCRSGDACSLFGCFTKRHISGSFCAFFTKRYLERLLHEVAPLVLASQSGIRSCARFTNVALNVDRLRDFLGKERGVAEVVGFVFVLAPAAPLTRDVRVTETGCVHERGGGRGGGDIVVS